MGRASGSCAIAWRMARPDARFSAPAVDFCAALLAIAFAAAPPSADPVAETAARSMALEMHTIRAWRPSPLRR
jgi:hypothetical protein